MQITQVEVSKAVVKGDRGIDYIISVNGDGSAVCECPSYRYQTHACKHIMFLYDNLLTQKTGV